MAEPTALRIGIQGVRASFHDAAARAFFKQPLELCECSSFRDLCQVLVDGKTDLNIMAIENSIAGSILPNYSLLEKFKLRVIGEVYLRIEMNLMALPGQNVKDIKAVQSHAMALFQCEDFLAAHPWMQVLEAADTAESAKEIKAKNLDGHAAIASSLAAEVYELEILAAGIETNKQNYTRFLVVSRSEESGTVAPYKLPLSGVVNKASLRFEIAHQGGSLLSVLKVFHEHKINMTKLQSVPLLGRPYQYSFHVDVEWGDRDDYVKAMRRLETVATNIFHFGEYEKSERPEA